MATKNEALSRGRVEGRSFLTEHRTTIVVTILFCIVLLGVSLRLENVLTKTLGQVETYVPGIPYPSGGVSDLETRLTIKDTVTDVILHDRARGLRQLGKAEALLLVKLTS